MLSIDEAIAKYKEITNTDAICPARCNISCDKCVQESEQIAEWLEDYKRIKMLIPIEQALKAEYNKAIDDFAKALTTMYEKYDIDDVFESSNIYSYTSAYYIFEDYIYEIAEQLKAGVVK